MNILELGAIGELVGGVAVIATLVYVGMQVRHSNQLGRAARIEALAPSAPDLHEFMPWFTADEADSREEA